MAVVSAHMGSVPYAIRAQKRLDPFPENKLCVAYQLARDLYLVDKIVLMPTLALLF